MRLPFFFILLAALTGCAVDHHSSSVDSASELGMAASVDHNLEASAIKAFKAGQYKQATDLFNNLLDHQPDHAQYHFYLAEALRLQGKDTYDKAITHYNLALEQDPGAFHAREGKALTHLMRGNLDNAVSELQELLQLDASRWRTVNALGVSYALKNRIQDAIEYYDMALQMDPTNPTILNNIGLSYALAGNMHNSILVLEDAMESVDKTNPRRKRIDHNLALIYGLMGRMDDAETLLRHYHEDAAVFHNLGIYAKMADDTDLARTYLSKALTASPVFYEKAWNSLENL